jgi:hypothetical protein
MRNARAKNISASFLRFRFHARKFFLKKIVAREKTISYLDRVLAHGIALARF